MICACIDIGSNTTRLLVADAASGQLRELVNQRAFTRIGKSLRNGDGTIPAEKIEETADVVRTQANVAREVGAERLVAVATAAIRQAANRDELRDAVSEAGGMELDVLSGEEEARLAFVGATRTLLQPRRGHDRRGRRGRRVERDRRRARPTARWAGRRPSGSAPASWPTPTCARIRPRWTSSRRCAGTWPARSRASSRRRPTRAVAVGGTATSLRRLVGAELAHETLERGIRVLSTTPIEEVATRFELDAERVRLLPAGILVLEAMSDLLELPLRIARGGLREGVLLELVEGRRLA